MPRLPDPRFAPDCTIEVDGAPVPARAGESVALALLAAGRALVARSAKYHRARGPFCLAGSCHRCLARIDGVPNERTCRAPCRPGLTVESQNALPSARHDLLSVVDLAFPHGLDHHHLATWNPLANRAAVAISRALAGLGRPADHLPSTGPSPMEERFDALVIGSGPAGLGAAEALAERGRRVLLVESEPRLGGRLRCGEGEADGLPAEWPEEVASLVAAAGGEVATSFAALGVWPDGGSPLVALKSESPGEAALRLVRAPRLVVATGSVAQPPLVAGNDLPGVLAARGVLCALQEHGIVPGERAVVLGGGDEAEAVAGALRAAGMEARSAPEVVALRGARRVTAARLPGGERARCDTLVFAGARAPMSLLARQAGAAVAPDPSSGGWRVVVDGDGATSLAWLRAAGEVTGPMRASEAAAARAPGGRSGRWRLAGPSSAPART